MNELESRWQTPPALVSHTCWYAPSTVASQPCSVGAEVVGAADGTVEGAIVGVGVGISVGDAVGASVGDTVVGAALGTAVGAAVGLSVTQVWFVCGELQPAVQR